MKKQLEVLYLKDNEWFAIGDAPHYIKKENVIKFLIEEGYIETDTDENKVYLIDDGYKFIFCNKENDQQRYAVEYDDLEDL